MSEEYQAPEQPALPLPEIVGLFSSREDLEAAVKSLRAAGFRHADLSVLDTHEALEAAEDIPWHDKLGGLVGLIGEAKYILPITTAGLLAIATGPVGAAISAVAGAGVAAKAVSGTMTGPASVPAIAGSDDAVSEPS